MRGDEKMSKSLSQEGLKLIACLTMVVDHIGAVLFPGNDLFRIVGRIAFPLYCFLLVEGAHYTRNSGKYAVRLLIGAVISEIPFDLAIFGWLNPNRCSAMMTLLLGYGMIVAMNRVPGYWKGLVFLSFYFLAELLHADYAGNGIAIIAWLALVWEMEHRELWRAVGLVILLWFGYSISLGPVQIPIELFGLLALIPIHFYRGEKRTESILIQWGFYLLYPAHLLILWGIRTFGFFL